MTFYLSSAWVPLLILIPNILFSVFPPQNIPPQGSAGTGLLVLTVLERMGQIGIFLLPLFYRPQWDTGSKVYLAIMVMALAIYYGCWIRYFVGGRDLALLYSSLGLIPIPLALAPIVYIMAAAGLMRSLPLLLAACLLAVGHIPISYGSFKLTN